MQLCSSLFFKKNCCDREVQHVFFCHFCDMYQSFVKIFDVYCFYLYPFSSILESIQCVLRLMTFCLSAQPKEIMLLSSQECFSCILGNISFSIFSKLPFWDRSPFHNDFFFLYWVEHFVCIALQATSSTVKMTLQHDSLRNLMLIIQSHFSLELWGIKF